MIQTAWRIARLYPGADDPRCLHYTALLFLYHKPLLETFVSSSTDNSPADNTTHRNNYSSPAEMAKEILSEDSDERTYAPPSKETLESIAAAQDTLHTDDDDARSHEWAEIHKSVYLGNVYAGHLLALRRYQEAHDVYSLLEQVYRALPSTQFQPMDIQMLLYKQAICQHRLSHFNTAEVLYIRFLHHYIPDITSNSIATADIHSLPICAVQMLPNYRIVNDGVSNASIDGSDCGDCMGAFHHQPIVYLIGVHQEEEYQALLNAMQSLVTVYKQTSKYSPAIYVQYILYGVQREHYHRYGRLLQPAASPSEKKNGGKLEMIRESSCGIGKKGGLFWCVCIILIISVGWYVLMGS